MTHYTTPPAVSPEREAEIRQAFLEGPEGKALLRDGVRGLLAALDAERAARAEVIKERDALAVLCAQQRAALVRRIDVGDYTMEHWVYVCRLCGMEDERKDVLEHGSGCLLAVPHPEAVDRAAELLGAVAGMLETGLPVNRRVIEARDCPWCGPVSSLDEHDDSCPWPVLVGAVRRLRGGRGDGEGA